MYCPYCGAELPEGSHFCMVCGKDVSGLNNNSKTATEEPAIQKQIVTTEQPVASYSPIPEKKISGFDTTKKGKSIAAFVLGILGMIFAVTIGWGLLGLIGIIVGIVALIKRHGIKWMAIVGLLLSAFSLVFALLVAIGKTL